MKKNVLLLCLSTLNPRGREREYSYTINREKEETENITVTGVMTNEAPAKAVIKECEQSGERLDKIVMICSEEVEKKIEVNDDNQLLDEIDLPGVEETGELTHVQFYKTRVDSFARDCDSCYESEPIEYVSIPIPNITGAAEVSKAVIDAANVVSGMDEDVSLYIDYNGGQRYIAFMILAVANLMKIRKVTIEKILTMNYEHIGPDKVIPIQNLEPVFGSFDLVAGINEYINFGRIRSLKRYFEKQSDQRGNINDILKNLEEFADNLQLCRTDYVMERRGELLNMLTDYSKLQFDDSANTYEQVFLYVVRDILDGCKEMLEKDLPDIIRWCVEKDFLQQALTFCTEELPGYFWRTGALKATKAERKEYNEFLEKFHNSEEKDKSLLKSYYRKQHQEDSSKYVYEWFTNYLPNSYSKKTAYGKIFGDEEYKGRLAYIGPSSKRKKIVEMDAVKIDDIQLSDEMRGKIRGSADRLIWYVLYDKKGKRASTNLKKDRLQSILIKYFLLKEQRNLTNHAVGEITEGDALSYEQIRKLIEQLVEELI